jgi:ribosomal protein S18 acetylase RimI-like enzyme/CelD/BcsL family acetyltransferase involved in cellulose biosynthesis
MRCAILHSADAFATLADRWDDLGRAAHAGLFLSHAWLSGWWRAFHGIDELWVFTVEDGDGELVATWPLHLRAPRSGALRVAELRLVGDLGGADRSVLCRAGREREAAVALVDALLSTRGWDVLDVPTGRRELGEALERAIVIAGAKLDRSPIYGRPYLELPAAHDWEEFARLRRPQRSVGGAVYATAEIDVAHALDELLRLLRKEWAAREAASPAADPQAVTFLQEMVPALHARGLLRLGLVGLEGAGAIAADLVVTDGDRAVQLLRGADPEHTPAGVSEQLSWGSIETAVRSGLRRFEFADEDPPWKVGRARVARLRLWSSTTAGRLHRGVTAITGAMRAIDVGPLAAQKGKRPPSGAWRALDKLKTATPDVVQRAVARVASYSTLHLYRGELFARNVRETGELTLSLFTKAQFDQLSEREREEYIARLDLQEAYCRQKWDRGDTVVLALGPSGGTGEPSGARRPAGILWCARAPVYVPDIGREVRPGAGECYIHDVYVHPDERGRQVAPAMLDFLARELRRRDVYRAWALIERTNVASTRAFEKAAYASVADVVYARMGLASRLIVRPPDPEARAFLGLT